MVGRWEVGEEQEMVQRLREKAGEDKEGGVWEEGGLGQEGMERLGAGDMEVKSPEVFHLQSTTTGVFQLVFTQR